MIILPRRKFLSLLAAPLIVSAASIMPVKALDEWSPNELMAGVLFAVSHFDRLTEAGFSRRFREAALQERANPRYIDHARLYFGSIA